MSVRVLVFLLLAGVLTLLVIMTLLLVGVEPQLVFKPGFVVKSWCEDLGLHVPNAVGVLSTGILYYAAIVAVWLIARRALTSS